MFDSEHNLDIDALVAEEARRKSVTEELLKEEFLGLPNRLITAEDLGAVIYEYNSANSTDIEPYDVWDTALRLGEYDLAIALCGPVSSLLRKQIGSIVDEEEKTVYRGLLIAVTNTRELVSQVKKISRKTDD